MEPLFFNSSNTFCIHLKSNTERLEKMKKRFEVLDMDVTLMPAYTIDDIIDTFPFYLNDGQKGCAQSHIHIWKFIVEHYIEYALILEDDACFDKEWKSKLDQFCKSNEDEDWDAIFLNASEPIEPRDTWVCTKDKEQYLTAGYVLSNKGARTLLEDFNNCYFSSDWMTSRLQLHGHSYSYFPWLIIQEGKDSDIGSNLEADREKVLHCLNKIQYSLDHYI